MKSRVPAKTRVVVIGGGIIGCSVAFHLAKLGWGDSVVLIERAKITSGSTFHAAGLVGQLRTNANITQLLKYSVQLYDTLEAETGQATGWRRNGGLRLAVTQDRWIELKRQATTARSFGLEMHLLTPKEAQELYPVMDVSDLVGAAFLPTDGQVNPSDVTAALAKGARAKGVKIIEDCPVSSFRIVNNVVTGVETAEGMIETNVVVNCAGQWANQLGKLAGVNVPLYSVQHQYMITEAISGVTANLPSLRDPDRGIYFKEEVGGLSMGGYEHNPIPWADNGVPEDFTFQLLDPNYDHFAPLIEQAVCRIPSLKTTGMKKLINGPESFTPDGNFILGESPEVKNFFVGAGFNAFGIASAGGAGRALAEWIYNGAATVDLWPVDIKRFGAPHKSREFVKTRTLEAYAHHYSVAWPSEELVTGRPMRTSALYDTLKDQGGVFGSKLGWERPNWFADKKSGAEAHDIYSFGRGNWHSAVGAEHKKTRESLSLFDESSFAKFELKGPGAKDVLSGLCANDVSKPNGSLVYTQMCNEKGGIECDLTVARLSDESFYITTGTANATRDFSWIRDYIRSKNMSGAAHLEDVTESNGVIGVMGPLARTVLSQVVRPSDNLSNEAFPFGTCREIEIAGKRLLALRVTFVGELGWELHIPRTSMKTVYDRISQQFRELSGNQDVNPNSGYRAIESLRLEKGYRIWGHEIGPDYTPLEAGLQWAVKLKSNIPFLGRQALEKQKELGLTKKLACFTVAPDIILHGRETIYRDGVRVGWLASGGHGYTVDRGIGFGYVRSPTPTVTNAFLTSGVYELEVATQRVPCKVHVEPLYDPKSLRVKM